MGTLSDIGVTPPLLPLKDGLVVETSGEGMFPHPFDDGAVMKLPIGAGLTIDWAPIRSNALVLALWAGTPERHSDEAIATVLSRPQVQQLILALMSIDAQMGSL
ncbi:MAG: hypothetical protein U9R64_12840 [Pseudomonadota bacterium]|nr:hypothetical protein [Pseudomonadota bacterium]